MWLTIAIELICIVLRFGFGQTSAVATASTVGLLTGGIRIHHGYVGAFMIPPGIWFYDRSGWGRWTLIIGVALFLSDMIHHFLVLWPMTGSPQFDFFYPAEAVILFNAKFVVPAA